MGLYLAQISVKNAGSKLDRQTTPKSKRSRNYNDKSDLLLRCIKNSLSQQNYFSEK